MAKIPAPVEPAAQVPVAVPIRLLRIVGPQTGRRRAGWLFGPEPTFLTRADLSDDQMAQLAADPLLRTTEEVGGEPVSAEAPVGSDARK